MDELQKKLESILFLCGEPISVAKLSNLLGLSKNEVAGALKKLSEEYTKRGVRLIKKDDEWQMTTAPEYSAILAELIKSEYSENLSRAAREVLAIIAYKGPLTRAEIEFIRGVNSVYSLRNLLMRGLIDKKENPRDGRSHIYSITLDFLRHFGLASIVELPNFKELNGAEVPLLPKENEEA